LRVTREGTYWLCAAGLLWLGGWYKGIRLVALLAVMLLVLWGINYVVAWRRLRHLRVRRSVAGPVFAGVPATVEVTVEDPQRKAQTAVHLDDRGPAHAWTGWIPRLAGGETVRCRYEVTLPCRGRYVGQPLLVSSTYPFGLVRRSAAFTPAEVVVLPRLGRLHRGRLRRYLAQTAFAVGRTRQPPRRHPTAQTEFHGLRAFRSGDSPRWIHWRTSARRGELMVREFEETPTDQLVLVVDPWLPAEGDCRSQIAECRLEDGHSALCTLHSALLEDALSLAATICWEWCRQKGERLVLAVAGPAPVVLDGFTSREYALRLLECLALQPGAPTSDTPVLLERLAAADLPKAPILLVSTRTSNLGDLLAGRLHRPVASLNVADLREPGAEVSFYEPPAR
jgi:uncharacterized protein (DUF58 family)